MSDSEKATMTANLNNFNGKSIYNGSAIYDINNYIWSHLLWSGVLKASDYVVPAHGLTPESVIVPIIPVQESAEVANQLGAAPYMVYVFQYPDQVLPAMCM